MELIARREAVAVDCATCFDAALPMKVFRFFRFAQVHLGAPLTRQPKGRKALSFLQVCRLWPNQNLSPVNWRMPVAPFLHLTALHALFSEVYQLVICRVNS